VQESPKDASLEDASSPDVSPKDTGRSDDVSPKVRAVQIIAATWRTRFRVVSSWIISVSVFLMHFNWVSVWVLCEAAFLGSR